VIDGRLPEAVGGEFIDANGLGGAERTRRGPRIVVGYMRFAENETLAHLYAEALRAGGYRVVVRDAGGLRREVVRALRRDRIDIYPDYSGTLLRFLNRSRTGRRSDGLRRALARIDAVPMRRARAQNRNVFVTKRATAAALAITKLSDLHGYWPGVDTQDAVAAQR
jgi:glycine betaine/choline ABC-type transport system substrate-binding protein